MMHKLPSNWITATFENAFEKMPKSTITAGEGQETGKYRFFTSSSEQTMHIDTAVFDGEFLIFGTGGNPSIHYCNEKFSTSTDCWVMKGKFPDLDLKYVYYFFKGNRALLQRGFRGAGLKHLSRDYLNAVQIPKPSLETQRKIVSILEKAEKLKENRAQADELTGEFLKAVFYEMFGDPVRNEKKWQKCKLSDILAIKLNSGWSPVCSDKKGDLPVLSLANLTENGLSSDIEKYYEGNPRHRGVDLEIGDLLISRSNVRELVGRIGRYIGMPKKVLYPDLMIRMRLDNKKASSIFFEKYLQNSSVKKIIQSVAHGSSGSMVKISQGDLEEIQVILPPIELQNKFAKIVEQVESIKQRQTDSKKQIDDLFNVLMRDAFNGKLSGGTE